MTRLVLAALLLGLAGCGGGEEVAPPAPTLPTAAVARARVETYIASDLRARAIEAGSKAAVTVHGVRCANVDRTHYVCRIRASSAFRKTVDEFVADAWYEPRTENASYDIRP